VQAHIPLYALSKIQGNQTRGIEVLDRRGRSNFTAMAATTVMGAPVAAIASFSPQHVTIALAARNSLYHLPLLLAEQLGYLRSEGLQIDWKDCESGSQAVQMALSGQADMVSGAFEHVLDLQTSGSAYRAFVLMSRAPQLSLGVTSRKAAVLKNSAELKLGISSLGSATHWIAQHWIRQVGLPEDAVQFVELGGSTSAVMEAMRAGIVDSLCHVDPILHYLAQKNELRIMADVRTLSHSQRMFGGALASACLFSKVEFLQRRADVSQALAMGVVRALSWLKTAGPTDILKSVPAHHWMGDRAMYLGALEKIRDSYSLDGVFGAEAVQTAWRARALRVGIDHGRVTAVERSFTNQFAVLARRKLHL
jgi:NitT/TauT family transport system substrate-binding protein